MCFGKQPGGLPIPRPVEAGDSRLVLGNQGMAEAGEMKIKGLPQGLSLKREEHKSIFFSRSRKASASDTRSRPSRKGTLHSVLGQDGVGRRHLWQPPFGGIDQQGDLKIARLCASIRARGGGVKSIWCLHTETFFNSSNHVSAWFGAQGARPSFPLGSAVGRGWGLPQMFGLPPPVDLEGGCRAPKCQGHPVLAGGWT